MATKYNVCISCGKYFLESQAKDKKKYCSIECEDKYVKCIICGEFYKVEESTNPKKYICSKECAKKYKFKKVKNRGKMDFTDLT